MAGEVGRRVREMHKHDQGREARRRALPRARARGLRLGPRHARRRRSSAATELLGRPMSRRARSTSSGTSGRRVGRLVGVREGDLPETWPEFRGLLRRGWSPNGSSGPEAVDDVLESLDRPGAAAAAVPAASAAMEGRARPGRSRRSPWSRPACCRRVLRDRFGIEWTARDEQRRFAAVGRGIARRDAADAAARCATSARATCAGAARRSPAATSPTPHRRPATRRDGLA